MNRPLIVTPVARTAPKSWVLGCAGARPGKRRSGRWPGLALLAIFGLAFGVNAVADVTGTAFRDYDGDGVQDTREPGVAGITVTAYDGAGAQAATTTTATDGSYTLSGTSGAVRVEFTDIPAYLRPGVVGADSATTVQFVNGTDSGVDVALGNPAEFNRGTPLAISAIHINGDRCSAARPPMPTRW